MAENTSSCDEVFPDWRVSERKAVEAACKELSAHTWVAEEEGAPVGSQVSYNH
jgi:hypothetical protein